MFGIARNLWLYIARRFIANIALVLVVVCGIIFSIECIENLRRATNDDKPLEIVFVLSSLRLPWLAEQVMPFALLIAAMMTFLTLGRSHELTVARSTGMSVWQFTQPVLLLAAVFGVLSTVALNPMASSLLGRHGELMEQIFQGGTGEQENRWLRQGSGRADGGSSVLFARSSRNLGRRLSGVSVFVYDASGAFERRIEAQAAELGTGTWYLTKAWTFVPQQKPVFSESAELATSLTPEQAGESLANPAFVSFWALSRQITASEQAGLNADAFRLQYQVLLARPLLYVAMAVIAASVSLRLFRFGNVGRMILGGIGAGFLLYVGGKVTGDLGSVGAISAVAAAWTPALVAFFLGTTVLLFQEDG